MSKPSYDEINIAIQNADLTHFQINKLVKALERKRSHAVLAIMPIEPSYQSIETLNEAKVKISELEKQCESYQANVDAMIHVFERDEQLNVIRRPNGKIEPYYSSSQWTEMFRAISERAAINLIDYAMDYLFPYAKAASKIEQVMQGIMDSVFKLKTSELKPALIGAAGELNKRLTDLIERRESAHLMNDLSLIIKDVAIADKLLIDFIKNPTKDNHQILKDRFEEQKTIPIKQLLDFRDNLPNLGRISGSTDKTSLIWDIAKGMDWTIGATQVGKRVIVYLEDFLADKTDNEIEMYSEYEEALYTLTTKTSHGSSPIRRDNRSLGEYMRNIKARNEGKLKPVYHK